MEPGQRGDTSANDSEVIHSGVFYGAPGRAEIVARLRERHGDEVTARWERSLALQAHPRPLTAHFGLEGAKTWRTDRRRCGGFAGDPGIHSACVLDGQCAGDQSPSGSVVWPTSIR